MESRPHPGEIPAPPIPEPHDDLYVIHYSQQRAEDCTAATPSVSAIIVQHVLSGEQTTFAALHVAERLGIPPAELPETSQTLEREALEEFFGFLSHLPRADWIHWGMRLHSFGFGVLFQRARLHGVDSVGLPPGLRFDLANHLKRVYGRDFAPHPRLWHASHRNGAVGSAMLTEEAASAAWKAGHHSVLLRSLSAKVHAIARLYELVRGGRFQIGGREGSPSDGSGPSVTVGSPSFAEDQPPARTSSAPSVSDLVRALRQAGKKGKPLRASLVELMANVDSLPVEEVAAKVHGDPNASCKRIQANVRRTNAELEKLAADFRFKVAASYVHKIPAGETGEALPKCCREVACE
jgi:hypothetical protein